MFDFNTLDVLTLSDAGRWCYPLHPRTARPISEGKDHPPIGFMLFGRHSAIAKDAMRQLQDQRAALEQDGRVVTEEDSARLYAEYLARCTKDWTPFTLDGAEFRYTAENAQKLWSDPRYVWLKPQITTFISDDAGFLPA